MAAIKNRLQKLFFSETLASNVFKKSFAALFVKVFGVLISFAVSVIIGRSVGADGLGMINLSSKILSLLMMFSLFGVTQIIVRETAKAMRLKNYKRVNTIINTTIKLSGALSLSLSAIFIFLSPWLANNIFNNEGLTLVFQILAISMPLQVLSRIYASAAIGMNKIWQGNLVNQTFTVFIVAIVLFSYYLFYHQLNIKIIVYSYLFGRVCLVLFFTTFWNKKLKPKSDKILNYDYKELLILSTPLLIASASVVLAESIATILLGYFANTKEIGLFSVSLRMAMFISFILQVTNSAISPKIAEMYKNQEIKPLQNLIYKITITNFIIGIIIFSIYLLQGPNILELWGKEFGNAYKLLIVLSIGEVINLSTGASGVILVMTGFQKIRRNIALASLIINVILSVGLIYYWGAFGAAIAVSLTILFDNALKIYFVYKKTNLKLYNSNFLK